MKDITSCERTAIRQRALAAWVVLALILVVPSVYSQDTDQAAVALQRAIRVELVDGDLEAAIALYKEIGTRFTTERAVVGKALLHLGQCYEKLGRPEAREAYERLQRDYADQPNLLAAANERLVTLDSQLSGGRGIVARQLYAGRNEISDASPSADGRYLFLTDWQGGGDLAMQEIATGEMRRLTDERPLFDYGGFAMFPLPSPDGKAVVFSWFNEESFWELRLVGLEGGAVRTLYRNEEVSWANAVGWTPDGNQILAHFQRTDGTNQIALVSVADGSARALKSTDWRTPIPSLSPDGQSVAYAFPPREDSLQNDIYFLAADGSRAAPLVEHPADDSSVIWVPDGSGILFVSDRTGTPDLWFLEIEDGHAQGSPRLVRRNMGPAMPRGFTDDGSLFYSYRQENNDIHVLTLDPDKGEILEQPTKLSQKHEGFNSGPDWSPDGKQLVYRSFRGSTPQSGNSVLIIRTLETGQERELVVPQLSYQFRPRWSPDGSSFLAPGTDTRGRSALYRVDSGSGDVQLLVLAADGSFGDALWAPDGDTIFYERIIGSFDQLDLVARDVHTGKERILYTPNQRIRHLTLSPDGQWIAGVLQRGSIVVVPTAGGDPREVLTAPMDGSRSGLAWMNNRDLLFAPSFWVEDEQSAQNDGLWRVSADGSQPKKLGSLPSTMQGRIKDLRVHPDGRRIAFTLDDGYANEIWVLEKLFAHIKDPR